MPTRQGFGWADFAALAVSGVAAALAPLQVFLLAYALLGPFHYLTEIAWLEKKQYYFQDGLIPARWYAVLAGVLSVVAATDFVLKRGIGIWVIGLLLLLSLSVWVRNLYALAALALAGFAVKRLSPQAAVLLGVIVPTFVHVFLFTGIFMLSGALRRRTPGAWKWLNPLLIWAIPLGLIFVSLHDTAPGAFWVRSEVVSFGQFHQYIAGYLHHPIRLDGTMFADPVMAALLRVSAFAYLFHYLNWFTKVEMLSWHRISRRGWIVLCALYAGSIGLYAWSITLGFLVSNFLSLLHVLLELPMDWRAVRFVAWGGRERRAESESVEQAA